MADPIAWQAAQARNPGKLKCPACFKAFVAGEEPEGLVPRIVEPCGCVVCTTCASNLAGKAPYLCEMHHQKIQVPLALGQFRRCHNVVDAISLLERLRKKDAMKAFPRAPKPIEPGSPASNGTASMTGRPLGGSFDILIHFIGRFDSVNKQEIAVKALHDLSTHPVSADELIAAGGIPYLVQVLAASNATLKIYAANALRNCAAASAAGRELVENSGAIPILVKQLGHKWWPSSKTVQEASVSALFELAGDRHVSDRIVESGGIKLLIKVMKKGSLSARALAAGVLGKLAIDIDLLVKMASLGGIPPLVRVCSTGMPMAEEFSSTLLSHMASVPQTHAELFRTQAVSQLIQTLTRGSPAAQEAAVRGLAVLANSPRDGVGYSPTPRGQFKEQTRPKLPFRQTLKQTLRQTLTSSTWRRTTTLPRPQKHSPRPPQPPPLPENMREEQPELESPHQANSDTQTPPPAGEVAAKAPLPIKTMPRSAATPSSGGSPYYPSPTKEVRDQASSPRISNLPMGNARGAANWGMATVTMKRATLGVRGTMTVGGSNPRLGAVSQDIATAGVPSLLQKARDLSIQEQAMAVLRDLAFSPEHRVAIANGGGIPVFVDILSARENATTCLYAASCLRSLALGNEWAEMVGESGAVPLLVALLDSNSPDAQDCAVGALANLAVNTRCRELIADADGLSALVKLLTNSSTGHGIQEMAVGALTNLAILPQNQVLIAAAGGIPPLVKRLQAEDPAVQAHAAGALWSLAQDIDNQARIAHWGGIENLIDVLSSGSEAAKLNTLGALRYLAENEENRGKIRDSGGIPPLATSFIAAWTEAPEIQELSCKCLLNLSISPDNHDIIVKEGCLPAAVRFLLRGSLVAQEYSAGLLLNLATNTRVQNAIAQSGAIAGLVSVLENGSTQAQANAIEALRNLSVDAASCRQISQAPQGIPSVVQQLCSTSTEMTGHAAGVIANLAACNQAMYHDSLAKAGALQLLVDLLKCSLAEQAAALGALRNLTSNMKWQVDLASMGAVPLIIQGLKHPDVDTRECAAAATGNFAAGNCTIRTEAGASAPVLSLLLDAVPSLIKLCAKAKPGPADDTAASAAGALWRLMAADNMQHGEEVKKRIIAAGGADALDLLLKAGSTRAKDNATKALDLLNDTRTITPRALPPTSPVEHTTFVKGMAGGQAIRVEAGQKS